MSNSSICYECGAKAALVVEPREVRLGRRRVRVDDAFMRCENCKEEFYLPGQLSATQRRAADVVRESEGRLSPTRIRSIREQLGLTQSAFERLLDSGPKTVVRWERGSVIPNGVANTLLRLLEVFPVAAKLLAHWHGVNLLEASIPGESLFPTRAASSPDQVLVYSSCGFGSAHEPHEALAFQDWTWPDLGKRTLKMREHAPLATFGIGTP
jgi:HTH-type transcriptional regulator/antitoxin MqsA